MIDLGSSNARRWTRRIEWTPNPAEAFLCAHGWGRFPSDDWFHPTHAPDGIPYAQALQVAGYRRPERA